MLLRDIESMSLIFNLLSLDIPFPIVLELALSSEEC
jgi:hypothetical protein